MESDRYVSPIDIGNFLTASSGNLPLRLLTNLKIAHHITGNKRFETEYQKFIHRNYDKYARRQIVLGKYSNPILRSLLKWFQEKKGKEQFVNYSGYNLSFFQFILPDDRNHLPKMHQHFWSDALCC